MQSNYFSRGDTSTWDRGQIHSANAVTTSFHTYTIDWKSSQITWSVDGSVVRTLSAEKAQGFPSSPSQLKVGSWVAGNPSNPEGTIGWAGGLADMSQAPFDFFVKGIYVQDYSTGTAKLFVRDSDAYEILMRRDNDTTSITTANPAVSPVGPVQNVTLPPVTVNTTATAPAPAVATTSVAIRGVRTHFCIVAAAVLMGIMCVM